MIAIPTHHFLINKAYIMKLLQISVLLFCLSGSITHAGLDLWSCCPIFTAAGPLFIREGFHLFDKANKVEKAREEYRQLQEQAAAISMEEDTIGTSQIPIPHGATFPPTYEAVRRRQGGFWIGVGAAMSMSALYTTGDIAYKICTSDKQD